MVAFAPLMAALLLACIVSRAEAGGAKKPDPPLPDGPDIVILIDDSLSMGHADVYDDEATQARAKKLAERMRAKLEQELPEKIDALERGLTRQKFASKPLSVQVQAEAMRQRLRYFQQQRDELNTDRWRPNRLQLAQAILTDTEPDWLKTLVAKQKTVHFFHLDGDGRAVKLRDAVGEVGDVTGAKQIDRARKAIAELTPRATDSRLGTAVRQIIDQYRGGNLSSIVLFSDGVTTRDETIAQVADVAARRNIALSFVGLGSEQERAMKLHDLQVEDTIFLGDRVQFEVRLTGQGFKDLTVPVVLRLKDKKDNKEREVGRQLVKVDATSRAVKIRFNHKPETVGRHHYSLQVELPKGLQVPLAHARMERVVEVHDTRPVRVLYVEGSPRWEYRFLKTLLERERKSIELKVLLLDASAEIAKQDPSALAEFPATLEDLQKYDLLILGDCDPAHKKLQPHLKKIAQFVRGENDKGQPAKMGGSLLFIAGQFHNPYGYKGTPIADVLPIEVAKNEPVPELKDAAAWRPQLTPMGRLHPIFRFSPDENESHAIWQRLPPMQGMPPYYRSKPLAEVLAVHPVNKQPLVLQQYVGTGRTLFFGFDETWRWRRDDEERLNSFWVQTVRWLGQRRPVQTQLRLDRRESYRVGEPIQVMVRFPDSVPIDDKLSVKVGVEWRSPKEAEPEFSVLELARIPGSSGSFEGVWTRTREGRYRFVLVSPDVSPMQFNGEKPRAETVVEPPPGEMSNLRMNADEMRRAAEATRGRFATLRDAGQVLDKLPLPSR